MRTNDKYLMFPIPYLKTMYKSKDESLFNIYCWGVSVYLGKLMFNDEVLDKAINSFIYNNYKRPSKNSKSLSLKVQSLNLKLFGNDLDYYGHNNEGVFEPIDEHAELKEKVISDVSLLKQFQINYYIGLANDFYNLEFEVDLIFKTIQSLKSSKDDNCSFSMLNINVWKDYYFNTKNEFQLVQLCSFLAIRSMLGKRDEVKLCFKTNKKLLLSRMCGYTKPINDDEINEVFLKYSKEYHFNKLIQRLELDWHIHYYSKAMRGFYVALASRCSLEQLIRHAERNRLKSRLKNKKIIKEQIVSKIRDETKDTTRA